MASIQVWGDGNVVTRAAYIYPRDTFVTIPDLPEGFGIATAATVEVVAAEDPFGNSINPIYVGASSSFDDLYFKTDILGVNIECSFPRFFPICFRSNAGIQYYPDKTGGFVTLQIVPDINQEELRPYGWLVIPQIYNSANGDYPYNINRFEGGYVSHGATLRLDGDFMGWSTYKDQKFIIIPLISWPIITFDPNHGHLDSHLRTKMLTPGSPIGELPTPTRRGYTFNGWWTQLNGGEQISAATPMPADHVIYYAHWNKKTCCIFLDAQGGVVIPPIIEREINKPYESIPIPVRGGHTFVGWFTEDNQEVSADTIVPSGDHRLYARWESRIGDLLYGKDGLIYDDVMITV